MLKATLTLLTLLPGLAFGQFPFSVAEEPTGEPEINYYKFYNGIQMVEMDYLSAHQHRVHFLEVTQPRALSWSMVLGPPRANVYFFRNEQGEIIKQYGEAEKTMLLSVQESLKKARHHHYSSDMTRNALLGYAPIPTRFAPYYLIGRPPELGLIDSLGNEVLPPQYDVIWPNGNTFIVKKGNTNELRDDQLKVLFSTSEMMLKPAQFHRGYAELTAGEKHGLVNASGKIIIPCEYDNVIHAFNPSGLARVQKNHQVGFADTTGKLVIACKYQNAGELSEGLINVRLDNLWGYIDTAGNTIIPHKYDIAMSFNEGRARVAKRKGNDYYYGFIDKQGNEIIPLMYSGAKDFRNGIAEVKVDGEWIKIDGEGKRLK